MYRHIQLGSTRFGRLRVLFHLVKTGEVRIAGNAKLKIYGKLNCKAGKRMKPENRVFFINEAEAVLNNYRPCAACMYTTYVEWKSHRSSS